LHLGRRQVALRVVPGSAQLAEDFHGAFTTSAATGGNAQPGGEVVHGSRAFARTLLDGLLRHGVADADIQGVTLKQE
jgi:hypothetical protein